MALSVKDRQDTFDLLRRQMFSAMRKSADPTLPPIERVAAQESVSSLTFAIERLMQDLRRHIHELSLP